LANLADCNLNSIVKRIVEKLNGEVGAVSANISGEGSRFYFILPLAE